MLAVNCLLPVLRKRLNGIADDVHKDLRHLFLVGQNSHAAVCADIANRYLLVVGALERDDMRQLLGYIDFGRHDIGLFGESRERLCNVREVVYLGNEHRRRFLEVCVKLLCAAQTLQFLNRQFHRRQRVVYLVRYLPSHRAPCAFAFGFRQLFRRLLYPIHQHIITLDERTEFVVIRIVNMIILRADGKMPHFVGQHRYRG